MIYTLAKSSISSISLIAGTQKRSNTVGTICVRVTLANRRGTFIGILIKKTFVNITGLHELVHFTFISGFQLTKVAKDI